MRLEGYYYSNDELKCMDCGGKLEPVYYYQGKKVDYKTYKDEALLSGKTTTTFVTTYANVVRRFAGYCPSCKEKRDQAARANNPLLQRQDTKEEKKRQMKHNLKHIGILLLSIALPIAFGYGAHLTKSSTGNAFSIFMCLCIGSCLLGIILFFGSISQIILPKYKEDRIMAEIGSVSDAEKDIVAIMKRREADKSITFFTESEYESLKPAR